MKIKLGKNQEQKEPGKKGTTIPAGTEQETGLTRGETEKEHAPVKTIRKEKEKSK